MSNNDLKQEIINSDVISLNNTKTIDENIKQQIEFTMDESDPNLISLNNTKTNIQHYKKDQQYRCKQIKKSVDIASKNKAILSLKYDNVSFKINCIQISVIVVSALITFIETLNALYELHMFVGSVMPILFATYIAISLSIMRFFKMDDTKETIGKTLENFSYIINKSRKSKHRIKNFDINETNLDLWKDLISNYENEIYEYMCNVRESFENILQYKERVYYSRRLLNHYVKNAFAHKNIDYVDQLWMEPHRGFEENLSSCDKLLRLFCCDKKNEIVFEYLNHLEELKMEKDEPKMDKEAPKMDKEELKMDKEELKMDKEELKMEKDEPKMDKEESKNEDTKYKKSALTSV
jgi:hypothetical protein